MTERFDGDEFIAGFISEAEEHLGTSNKNLLSVEVAAGEGKATPRQVRELFRSFHTIKGLAAMVGVEPIVEIAHAMESVLREADRAAGRLPPGSVELLLKGVRAIEHRIEALGRRQPVPAPPDKLVDGLNSLRQLHEDRGAVAELATSLRPELWAKLSPAERTQLVQGLAAGRRGRLLPFVPTLARASQGITITSVRERVAAGSEIVKIVPQSMPATLDAPGGLSFALVLLTNVSDDVLAAAADTATDALTPIAIAMPSNAPAQASGNHDHHQDDDDRKRAQDPDAEADERRDVEVQRRGVVRVDVARLDDALERLSALVVTQFRFVRALNELEDRGVDGRAIRQVVNENGRQLRDLRASIMRARMVSVAELLERIPLIVRGLSRSTGKNARVVLSTGRAELDKAVAERIFPAIVHLVRNAVDHALETPDERTRLQKPPTGVVTVACHERAGNQLELTVADDGEGVDAAAVARRAGVAVPASDAGLLELLTRPGLSTKAEVTTTSGRGVGMDVVKRIAVDELRGELSMTTSKGQGTTFALRIPLSITIIDAFSFTCGGETFLVPVSMVEEIQELDLARTVRGPDRRKTARGDADRRQAGLRADLIQRRGEAVPVLRLEDLLGLEPTDTRHRKAIIVRRSGEPFAFVVDRMLGQQEIVVRPMEDWLVRVHGVSGTTDLGDGRPTLVLDLAALGGRLLADAAGMAS